MTNTYKKFFKLTLYNQFIMLQLLKWIYLCTCVYPDSKVHNHKAMIDKVQEALTATKAFGTSLDAQIDSQLS